MKGTWCFVILLSILIKPGFAILCYECHEVMGSNLACENNVETVLTPNCTASFQCIKYIFKNNATREIYRGCGPKSRCEELSATATNDNILEYCGTCDSPLCNSGYKPNYAIAIGLSTLLYRALKVLA